MEGTYSVYPDSYNSWIWSIYVVRNAGVGYEIKPIYHYTSRKSAMNGMRRAAKRFGITALRRE